MHPAACLSPSNLCTLDFDACPAYCSPSHALSATEPGVHWTISKTVNFKAEIWSDIQDRLFWSFAAAVYDFGWGGRGKLPRLHLFLTLWPLVFTRLMSHQNKCEATSVHECLPVLCQVIMAEFPQIIVIMSFRTS